LGTMKIMLCPSSQLGLLVGPDTQTTLRHQIASAGQKPVVSTRCFPNRWSQARRTGAA